MVARFSDPPTRFNIVMLLCPSVWTLSVHRWPYSGSLRSNDVRCLTGERWFTAEVGQMGCVRVTWEKDADAGVGRGGEGGSAQTVLVLGVMERDETLPVKGKAVVFSL